MVEIVLGRHGDYTPKSGKAFQKELLEFLAWMSQWKLDHEGRVRKGRRTEFHFFADDTWRCIQMMVLGHVVVIEVWCLQRRMKVNPKVMNTDPVEHHFGNLRQMIAGSHAGFTSVSASQADTKYGLAKTANYNVVENNKCADGWGISKVKH